MGISFQVAKTGTRYRPKFSQADVKDDGFDEEPSMDGGNGEASGPNQRQIGFSGDAEDMTKYTKELHAHVRDKLEESNTKYKEVTDKHKKDNVADLQAYHRGSDDERVDSRVSLFQPNGNDGDEGDFVGARDDTDSLNSLAKFGLHPVSQDIEVSFSLNLFPDGFSVGKATEGVLQPLFHDVQKWLHPYGRVSETLFSPTVVRHRTCMYTRLGNDKVERRKQLLQAIEYGRLPGAIFDDIPCKYVNGAIVCEIRDYRNCMPQQGDTVSSGKNSPVVHKVCLKMCMENVVKDISSISDDSWTYKDLLEVESRILKALQPELCLNPTPLLDRTCGAPPTKKLNLGIAGGRTERKLSGAPAPDIVSNNLFHGNYFSSNYVFENSKSQSNLAFQHKGFPSAQQTISKSFPNSLQNNIAQEALVQSLPRASLPNSQVAVSYERTISNAATPSSFLSVPERNLSDSSRNSSKLLLGKRDLSEARPTAQTNIKKPKQDQLDLVQQQLPGSRMDTNFGPDLQLKTSLLEQHLESEKIRNARFGSQKHLQLLMNDSPQAVLEGIPKLQAGMHSHLDRGGVQYRMKQELTEISELYKSEVGKIKYEHNVMDIIRNQYNLQQSHLLHVSPHQRANVPIQIQGNHLGQPVEKDLRREDTTQKRSSSQNLQVSARGVVHSPVSSKLGEISTISMGVPYSTCSTPTIIGLHKKKTTLVSVACAGSASASPGYRDSLVREVSLPAKRKSSSLPKTSSMSGAGSSASVCNLNAVSANSTSVGTSPQPLPSGTEDELVLERFLKIEMVAQRYGLNDKKHKFDQFIQRKPFSHIPSLLGVHLSNSEDTQDLKDATADKLSVSKCLRWSFNVPKTRILTFLRPGRAYQGNGTPIIACEAQNKLVMLEIPKDGMVEVRVMNGYEEEIDNVKIPQYLIHTLPNTHYADLFVDQFTSLMAREGYQLTEDQILPTSLCTTGASSSQQPSVTTGASLGDGAAELPPLTPISGYSSYMSGPMSSSISALNPQQSPSQNILAGRSLLTPGNIQAALQISAGYLPKPQQLGTAHIKLMQQQQQQHLQIQRSPHPIRNSSNPLGNYPGHLQLQLQQAQRHHQQQLLLQRKMMVGGLGASVGMGDLGTMHPGGGVQGFGNLASLESLSNGTGTAGVMSAPVEGYVPGLSNVGQINNLGSHASSFSNPRKQLLAGGISDPTAAVLAKLRLAQSRGRAMLNGPSMWWNLVDSAGEMTRNNLMQDSSLFGKVTRRDGMAQLHHAGTVSMRPPMISDTIFTMSNHQQPQPQIHQQQQQIHQQLLRQKQLEQLHQMGSPPHHFSPPQISQQTQMSPQQLSSASVPQQVNAGKVAVGPGSPQLSSQTHGSVGSITSSTMELPGVTRGA
ncbi:hypothetical protein HHK36_024596 [Tetracentron sinense]|uniref:Uncharacterized protein n=1 Tax=Tetracentron sinense TaxID=13715 RepID=A0A834YND2_TETSI|nr:hypothetical protein HHK36_024596 [Tetracentron sinense]